MRTDLEGAIGYLRSATAIRARCETIYKAGLAGQLQHFTIDLAKMPIVIDRVVSTIRAMWPELDVPVHGRLNQFPRERLEALEERLTDDPLAWTDLVVTSVVWGDPISSLDAFEAGQFSSDPLHHPLRADIDGLRAGKLRPLGDAMAAAPHLFPHGRPGDLIAVLGGPNEAAQAGADRDATWPHRLIPSIDASAIFRALVEGLGPVWGGYAIEGVKLGDIGTHTAAGGSGPTANLVPLHATATFLAYSLYDPFERAGYTIAQPGALAGIGDDRNGALLVELGLLAPKYMEVREIRHAASDEVIVEWRALTIAALDLVAKGVRQALGKSSAQLPLSNILAGTAAAFTGPSPIRFT